MKTSVIEMNAFINFIWIYISPRNVEYKLFRLLVISGYTKFEKKIVKRASNNIDLAHRSDNIILMNPLNVIMVCTTSLTDGAYTVEKYPSTNYKNYKNCQGVCFIIELNKNMNIMSIAVWYKKNNEMSKIMCSNPKIKILILASLNYSKKKCEDIFVRESNTNINMVYANCKRKDKFQTLLIDIDVMNENVVEIAVYNKWKIEHLPLRCLYNKSMIGNTIKSKKLQTIPWNLTVESFHHGHIVNLNQSYYNKVLTDYNMNSCYLYHFNRKILLFTFEFNGIVLMESITFITGNSLENNTLFEINHYSNTPDSPYLKQLEDLNECNIKPLKDMTILYNS